MSKDEVGWLIEKQLNGRAVWLRGAAVDGREWTTDANEAIRFSRQQDATAALAMLGSFWQGAQALEHMWSVPAELVRIIINGLEFKVGVSVSYEQIVQLAGKRGTPSVAYSTKGKIKRSGSMHAGTFLDTEEGMVFNAMHTGNA